MTGTENFCFRIGSGVGLWCDGPAAAGFRKGENIMELGEGLKKILLVGIGTAAVTAEKSKEILDELVKKGELTVEQGKVLNEELKHNLKQTVKNNVNVKVKVTTPEELSELLDKMTPEQLEALKAQIKAKESTVDSEAEEVNAEDTVEDVENVEDAEVVEEETKEE